MSKKLFVLISALITAVQSASIALVTYFVQDTTLATAINGCIALACPCVIACIKLFVIDKIQNKKNK